MVALVASAGGIQAVATVLAELPGDLAAAVIVLIHQEPDRMSALTAILARRCALAVAEARDGALLAPGSVTVIPPGRHLLVRPGGRTALIGSGSFPPNRPSADLLLATMATSLGPRAIAVVLSGKGQDAATGATAVHACGGVVVATDEATSTWFSMPHATIERAATVDRVVALGEVARCVTALVEGGRTSPAGR